MCGFLCFLSLLPQVISLQLVIDPKAAKNAEISNSAPIDLTNLFNSKAFAKQPGEGELDGVHSGYPAELLPPPDLTLHGVNFKFPQYNSTGHDNVLALGQTVNVEKGRYFSVHMLAASEAPTIASGFLNATYTDSSTTSEPVLVDPWWNLYPYGGQIIFPYYLSNSSRDYNRSSIFQIESRLDSTKELAHLQLPNITAGSSSGPGGAAAAAKLHIFAVSLVPANASGLHLDVQYARTTQTWLEGTNKTQIVEATINNIGDSWILSNNSVKVTVSSEGVDTVTPGVINRLRPGDQAVVQIGVVNKPGVPAGTPGQATVHVDGAGVQICYSFNGTYGIAQYEPTFESIYSHEASPWYRKAKYGIFIHWGVYSVPGWGNSGKNETYAEWYWYDYSAEGPENSGQVYEYNLETYGPNHEYDDFIQNFTADKFDPKEWVDLFSDAGANYFVQVSKHHDKYALFDLPSNVSERTSVKQYPHRNLLQELFDAAAKYQPQLHRSTYFSLPEWFNPAYKKYGFRLWPGGNATNPYTNETQPYTGFVNVDDYVSDIILPSMNTLAGMETEIMWCDVGGPNLTTEFAADYLNDAAQQGRQVLLNNRCGIPGDFNTPEYAKYGALPSRKWESNLGMDPFSYGYNRATPEDAYMKPDTLVQALVDITSKNGNFLLDVGPQANGTIIEVEQRNLRAAGKWIKSHGEAIFSTENWFIAQQEGEAIRFTQTPNSFYILSLYPPNGTLVVDSPVPYVQGDQITTVGGNMNGTVVPARLADNGSLIITVSDAVTAADQYTWVFKIDYVGCQ